MPGLLFFVTFNFFIAYIIHLEWIGFIVEVIWYFDFREHLTSRTTSDLKICKIFVSRKYLILQYLNARPCLAAVTQIRDGLELHRVDTVFIDYYNWILTYSISGWRAK